MLSEKRWVAVHQYSADSPPAAIGTYLRARSVSGLCLSADGRPPRGSAPLKLRREPWLEAREEMELRADDQFFIPGGVSRSVAVGAGYRAIIVFNVPNGYVAR